jgi:bile acid:Na+ symporter, BASS family
MPDLIYLTGLCLKASIVMQVFAIGLSATWTDATYLFKNARLLWNSILARNVVIPVVVVLMIKALPLHAAVAVTLGVLAVTPAPPLLPKSQLKAGARSEYVLGLIVSQSVLAVAMVPFTIQFMNWTLGSHARFGVWEILRLILQTILVPLTAGMVCARLKMRLQRLAPALMLIGTVLLLIGALPMLLVVWKTFGALRGDGSLLSIAIFIIAGTAVGHVLGGPDPRDRTTLAIATAARHPAIALAIAKENFPQHAALVTGAVAIYLMMRIVLSLPYLHYRRAVPNETVLQR